METQQKLLKLLADGMFHSGDELGEALHISRTAIWKHIQRLLSMGVVIDVVRGRGYRIPGGIELLDPVLISSHLAQLGADAPPIIALTQVDSTNSYLLREYQNLPTGAACLAEVQTEGRGRRGRRWVSPFGNNICLSLLWRFPEGIQQARGLSLVVGVLVHQALQAFGANGALLKWPNDLYYQDKKLAGILIELRGEADGPCTAVIGVGVNLTPSPLLHEQVDQPWSTLSDATKQPLPRNQVAAQLMASLQVGLEQFSEHGLAVYQNYWQQYDYLDGRSIRIKQGNGWKQGIARGINEAGDLLLEVEGQLQACNSGEVTVQELDAAKS